MRDREWIVSTCVDNEPYKSKHTLMLFDEHFPIREFSDSRPENPRAPSFLGFSDILSDPCGVTYPFIGRSPPTRRGGRSLDHPGVCLWQPLNGCLVCKATSDVLPQKGNDLTFFLAKVLRIRPSGSHDSQRECKTTRGHVISPWGGGMLGNIQQNSTKLILSIYSLSNVCKYLL